MIVFLNVFLAVETSTYLYRNMFDTVLLMAVGVVSYQNIYCSLPCALYANPSFCCFLVLDACGNVILGLYSWSLYLVWHTVGPSGHEVPLSQLTLLSCR